MNFRTPHHILRWLFIPKQSFLEEFKLNFIVMPLDIDFNLHLNNAKYLGFMDIGRMDATVRSGLFKAALKNKWQAVAASVNIVFRKEIPPFARFYLITKLISFDDKWFYVEQDFIHKGKLCAKAIVKVGMLKGKLIEPKYVLEKMGIQDVDLEMPEYLKELIQGEKDFIATTK